MTPKQRKAHRRAELLKADVVEAFDGIERQVALALDISAQAVNNWGTYVPRAYLLDLLTLKPQLAGKIKRTRTK